MSVKTKNSNITKHLILRRLSHKKIGELYTYNYICFRSQLSKFYSRQLILNLTFIIVLFIIKMQKKEEMSVPKKRNFMTRNVTEFKHLMKNRFITENDLDWVITLRDKMPIAHKKSHIEGPPQVYFKKTKTFENKTNKNQNEGESKIHANQYDQIYLKSPQKGHHTISQIQFYSSLRTEKSASKLHNCASEKQFDTIPFKYRKEMPKFIKKEFIKSTRPITKTELEDGLDGAHKQQPYTQKIIDHKNYALLQSFTKIKGRNQVSLPMLAWQMGLRNYR